MKYLLFIVIFLSAATIAESQNQFTLDSLLAEYNNAKEDTTRINILVDISKLYLGNNLIEAINYIDMALPIAQNSKNKIQIVKLMRAKGGLLTYMGNYTEGLEYFLGALKLAEEINEPEEVFPLYINIGAIHANMNDGEKAKNSYLKALDVYNSLSAESKSKVANKLGSLYNNLGNTYQDNNDNETAQTYYLKSYYIGLEMNDKKLQVFPLRNLGDLFKDMNEPDSAVKYINNALALAKSINDKDEIAKCYQSLAEYYINTGNYSKALEIVDSSYFLAKQIGSLKTMQVAAGFQYMIYEKNGDYKNAFLAHQHYKQLSDSLINESIIGRITSMEMQYQYNKYEEENKAKQQKKELIILIVISVLLLIIVIVILLFILLKNRHKRMNLEKLNLEKEVEIRNKELATNVMYLVEKNEFINSVSKRLINLKSSLKDENKEPVQKIIYDIQSSVDKEIWEEFELRFQKVHTEFYNNLQNKFPDLSMTERKLAAFLRLDMTSKDIAVITGQSIKSVEVARSRLRKKLGIANKEINLVNFLLEI